MLIAISDLEGILVIKRITPYIILRSKNPIVKWLIHIVCIFACSTIQTIWALNFVFVSAKVLSNCCKCP